MGAEDQERRSIDDKGRGSGARAYTKPFLDNYKWLRASSVYDYWLASSFAKQSPLPFYVKDSVSLPDKL